MGGRRSTNWWLASIGALLLVAGEAMAVAEGGRGGGVSHLVLVVLAVALALGLFGLGGLPQAWRRAGSGRRPWGSALLGFAGLGLFVGVLFAHLNREVDDEASLAFAGALLIAFAAVRLEP